MARRVASWAGAPGTSLAAALRRSGRKYQFVGWFALGVVAFGAEVIVLGVLHQWLRCPLWLASALAAEIVLLGRFLSTDHLIFGHARPTLARCVRFHAAAVGSFVVSWLVLNGVAGGLNIHYVVAAFLGSVAAFGWSAVTNFLWVWPPVARRVRTVEVARRGN